MIISDQRKCNFYNVGYCKNFDKGCTFFHPKESCNSENCDYKTCPKDTKRIVHFSNQRNYVSMVPITNSNIKQRKRIPKIEMKVMRSKNSKINLKILKRLSRI